VSLDFFPKSPPVTVDWSQESRRSYRPLRGNWRRLRPSVENIINKLDKVPFQEIGEDLQKAIAQLNTTLVSAQGTLTSARGTLDNTSALTEPKFVAGPANKQHSAGGKSRPPESLRVLADYLERHPDALLRGKARGRRK